MNGDGVVEAAGAAGSAAVAAQPHSHGAALDPERVRIAGDLNAGLAHDLRNLLAIAESSVFVAKRRSDDAGALATQLDRASGAIRAAQSLVSATLAYARGEELARERRPLGEMLAKVKVTSGTSAERIHVDVDPPDLLIDASPILVFTALQNLVKNAAEASRGDVRVIARETDDAIEIAVLDDGPGLDPKCAGDFPPSTKPGGCGLGLRTARATARAHGGKLVIDEVPTGGRVVFSIPRSTARR